jgi:hypothetical protein
MKRFIATINTSQNVILKFCFTHIYTIDGECYFITTFDRDIKLHSFYMKPVANTWQIVQPAQKLASWVMEMEHELAAEIKKRKQLTI